MTAEHAAPAVGEANWEVLADGSIVPLNLALNALERAVVGTVCAAELAARVYREWRDGANPLYWSSVEGERLLSLCTEAIAARYAAVDSYLAARAAP